MLGLALTCGFPQSPQLVSMKLGEPSPSIDLISGNVISSSVNERSGARRAIARGKSWTRSIRTGRAHGKD